MPRGGILRIVVGIPRRQKKVFSHVIVVFVFFVVVVVAVVFTNFKVEQMLKKCLFWHTDHWKNEKRLGIKMPPKCHQNATKTDIKAWGGGEEKITSLIDNFHSINQLLGL
jgi:hypothetical protein